MDTPNDQGLVERLKTMVAGWLPFRVETQASGASEPPALLAGMTADGLHSTFRAAEQGDTREMFTLFRDVLLSDTHLQSEIDKRFMAILGDDPVIQPKSDATDDVAAADAIRAAIDRVPDFTGMCADLLWGNFWPLALVERTYKRATVPGLLWDWDEWIAVPDHLLRWQRGVLKIELCDATTSLGTGEYVHAEPNRYITHRGHFLRTPDNWGGPMRSLCWWFFLKTMDREWWVRFLDKYGTPFTVAKYDKNDDASRQILERAFRMSTKIGGLVVTKETQIELIQAMTQGSADAYKQFHDVCNREISKRIVGQTLSSEAQSTGLGSGTSSLQGEVRDDIAKFDKKKLAQTLRQQLFMPFLRLNGLVGKAPDLIWGEEETEENSATATSLSSLKTAGIEAADEALPVLSKRFGFKLQRVAAIVPEPTLPPAPAPPKKGTKKLLSFGLPYDPSTASQSISREAAATLSQTLRGTLAPARDIILSSDTPEAAQSALLAVFTDWTPGRAAEIVESALGAGAWNGAQD